MKTIDAFFLGIIQGLTEFLPISSSGHLVLFQKLLGYHEPLIAFDVVVHMGTLIAIMAYFFKDIKAMAVDTTGFVLRLPKLKSWDAYFHEHVHALTFILACLTTAVTAIIAIIFKDAVVAMFASVQVVGCAWIIMGVLLLWSVKIQEGNRDLYQMSHYDAFVIGLVQGCALIPGISRSGITILCGMFLGLGKKTAAKFSFMTGLLVIAAAGVMEAKDGFASFGEAKMALIVGFFASAVVGYLAIFILMKIIEKGRFFIFGFYCLLLGCLTLTLSFLGYL